MKTASGTMIALLNGGQEFLIADLYTFTLNGGFIARYTGADAPLTVGGNAFAVGPLITRSKIMSKVGLEVQTLDMTINADNSMLLNGTPWLQAARSGGLDGCRVLVERAFMPTWGDTSAGKIWMFSGNVSDLEVTRTAARLKVKSDLEKLNMQWPRNLYQPGCLHTLYDSGCALSKGAFGWAAIVTSQSSVTQIYCNLPQADDYYSLGTILFYSGANNGVSRTVKKYYRGVVTLSLPLLTPPSLGDALAAYPGCDKQQSTCSGKFSNLNNFRGFPYVPAPDTVLG